MIKDTAVQILLEHFSEGMVRTIVDAIAEDEREECAKLCMPEIGKFYKENVIDTMLDCEFAIRARVQE